MIRIGLVDDEPLFTAGLALLLDVQADIEVAWQASNGAEALEQAEREPVDLLLMDIQMPVLDGVEATRRFVARGLVGRVVVLTTFDTESNVLSAIEAGASGFLLKTTPPPALVEAIRTVHSGDCVISPGPTRRLLGAVRASGITPAIASASSMGTPQASAATPAQMQALEALTSRERDILRLIAEGLTNQEICDREWLSMATVKTHVSHLLLKTGARDRVQLVLFALRSGLTDLSELLSSSPQPS